MGFGKRMFAFDDAWRKRNKFRTIVISTVPRGIVR